MHCKTRNNRFPLIVQSYFPAVSAYKCVIIFNTGLRETEYICIEPLEQSLCPTSLTPQGPLPVSELCLNRRNFPWWSNRASSQAPRHGIVVTWNVSGDGRSWGEALGEFYQIKHFRQGTSEFETIKSKNIAFREKREQLRIWLLPGSHFWFLSFLFLKASFSVRPVLVSQSWG